MIEIKKDVKLFFKAFYLSGIILLCAFMGIFGIFKAYESMRQIGFGEYRRAVEIEDDRIKILDFEIEIG